MEMITIVNGTYKIRGEDTDVSGHTFPMVREFQIGKTGGFVTVDASEVPGFPDRNIKIKVDSAEDYAPANGYKKEIAPVETDEQTVERMRLKFSMLEDMTKAAKSGAVKAMIVSGPPGVGKSFGVEKVLNKHDLVADIAGDDSLRKYVVIKGAVSALGLYAKLYQYSEKDNVIVFDDCDIVFDDVLSLNILKAALDSKKNRTISWNTDSYKLRNEGIPDSFTFRGSVIFITNIKFDNVKSKKLRDHLEALESRCHYLDLTIDTEREKILRIKQIVKDGMLDEYGFTDELHDDIVDFVDMNKKRLRELSLRSVLKTADLAKAFPDNWEAYAQELLMRKK
jgi:predicted AAA+ superfamily ATPase